MSINQKIMTCLSIEPTRRMFFKCLKKKKDRRKVTKQPRNIGRKIGKRKEELSNNLITSV